MPAAKGKSENGRRTRPSRYTARISVLLTVEDRELFERIAGERQIPPAILARDWIVERLAPYRLLGDTALS